MRIVRKTFSYPHRLPTARGDSDVTDATAGQRGVGIADERVDTGKFRGGLSAEVALTLGGIARAEALVMTHGAEVPNTMGLGGGWPGNPDSTTVFPQYHDVDYVRVYQKDGYF